MRLKRVDIRNFRSIKEARIEFDPACRILVGMNEAGKSNILAALALLDEEREVQPDDQRSFLHNEDSDKPSYVRFVFSLSDSDRKEIEGALRLQFFAPATHTPVVKFEGHELPLTQLIALFGESLYQVDINTAKKRATVWAKKPNITESAGVWLRANRALQFEYRTHSQVVAKPLSLVHGSLIAAGATDGIETMTPEAIFQWVAQAVNNHTISHLPNVILWTYSEANLLPSRIPINEFAADPSSCEPLQRMFALAGIHDISDGIASARQRKQGLRNLVERVASRTTGYLQSAWREFRDASVSLSATETHFEASVRDKDNHFDFARRSDGFKRFVSFLLMVSSRAHTKQLTDTLVLLDEADAGLHPSGIKYLLTELIAVSASNFVVCSTHSPFMIDRDRVGRHLIVRKKHEITTVIEASGSNFVDEEVLYNALGYSVFDSLKKMNVIFEGWQDKRLAAVAARTAPRDVKQSLNLFGLCHADGVKDIGRITSVLELADRQWCIVSDRDKVAKERQKEYKGDGPWWRYDELGAPVGVTTAEDFVRPQAFARITKATLSEVPSLPPVADIQFDSPAGKVAALRAWLEKSSLEKDEQKARLKQIKSAVFESLTPANIEDSYAQVLAEIAKRASEASGRS